MSETSLLQQAQDAIQRGDKAAARQFLYQATVEDPQSETAWLWLSVTADTPEHEKEYLGQVLTINPHNEPALSRMLRLKSSIPDTPLAVEEQTALYIISTLRAILYYLITTAFFLAIFEAVWLIAKDTIDPTNHTSGWYILIGLLIGGPDHTLIVLTSLLLAGPLTTVVFLAEISAKLTLRRNHDSHPS